MKKTLLCVLFAAFFLMLLSAVVRASSVRSVADNAALMQDVWFQVTLLDAYLCFLTIYIWIAWKEQIIARQAIWFVLVMAFGNLAVSLYVLLQIKNLPRGGRLSDILTSQSVSQAGVPSDSQGGLR